ncbi:Plasma-membrane proton-efflux P-type ATPase [Methanocaldococcus lauensis]|uniref:Plasma-membrane proton-efflux P-type ATPase n=1 Tax=Methanocaldococcus lauensis TaxID=2546128 RepID=A0A8D6PSS6_9EURY|nr:plasma-membrane proton-efflux P-type ATPase [Methanocaldococcus lauensis]CAB3289397.1 Plasma-membrane proton-efflux P-type ATPase [Methanocaldococcus lauensis]
MGEGKIEKKNIEEILKSFNASLEYGLSSEEAEKRLKIYGYNEIEEKKVNPIIKFLSYFWGPIPWMIEIAAILSALVKDWADFFIILSLLIVNGVVGFWEEHKAENVVETLKQKMALKAKVLRDGVWKTILAKFLVPGDIVRVKIGDIVPADMIIVKGDYVTVDESALTGESLPVTKYVGDELYSGSIVKKGEAIGVVKATGINTYFGKTVKLVESAKTVSSFQKMIISVGNYLIVVAIILIAIIFVVSVYRHESLLETLRFALVLAVASIPAAMPAVLSITMAIGALNLAKKQAVVTKLVSIEELASVDVLCSDKTGTLTKNQLVCGDVIPFNNFKKEDVIFYAALASNFEDADAIDNAILNEAKKLGLLEKLKKFKLLKFIPFDPVIKRTEATVSIDGKEIKVSKGAPQVIVELCNLAGKIKEEILKIIEKLAEQGYRSLGVSVDRGKGWEFVGIIPLYDPPREDAPEAISRIKKLGVIVKMITGDHIAIARNIAKMLGIGDKIVSMTELLKKKKESEIEKLVEEADGFSEVYPEHKYKIVEILQKKGHFVGMTGDGVNDAPALKKANCGIAVAGATDAARAAADIVLLAPGISVIADAITEARRIFQRMESYVIYRICETIRILFFMTLSILVFNFYPITALMVVLLALLNDIPILAIAYDNVIEQKKPVRWEMKKILPISTILGLTGVVSSFLIYYIAEMLYPGEYGFIQTFIFLKLIIAGHSTIFVTRTKDWLWKKPYPSPLLFWGVMITNIIGTLIAVYGILVTPIGWGWAIFIWIYATIWMFINDVVKKILVKKLNM